MATGGVLKAVCVLSATRMPKKMGSTLKGSSSGRKIGTKMMMISVHSSGQPSRKMMNWARTRNCHDDRFIERKKFSITDCPPRSANTAEKVHDPINVTCLRSRSLLTSRVTLSPSPTKQALPHVRTQRTACARASGDEEASSERCAPRPWVRSLMACTTLSVFLGSMSA